LTRLRFEEVSVANLGMAALLGVAMAFGQRSLLVGGRGWLRAIMAGGMPGLMLLFALYWYTGATPQGVAANGYFVYTNALKVVLDVVVACAAAAVGLAILWLRDVLRQRATR
jgi:hypothetical protein